MICVSVAHIPFSELDKLVSGFEMFELRLDLLDYSDVEYQYLVNLKKPVIATFRYGEQSDELRMQQLKKAIIMGVDYVDIEIDASPVFVEEMLAFAKKNKCKSILSYHNFDKTPNLETLNSLIEESKILGADYIKMATRANSKKDVARTMSLYENNKNLIAFNMGELGKVSRLSCLFLGAEFSYVAIDKENATAEGQMTNDELKTLVNYVKH